jgi:hypothetical protein
MLPATSNQVSSAAASAVKDEQIADFRHLHRPA